VYYVLGGDGFVGSAVCSILAERGESFVSIGRDNYPDYVGTSCDVFVNCDGNARRFWANENPTDDFEASVSTTMRSLSDFQHGLYVFLSSVDVYVDTTDPTRNAENSEINYRELDPYGFHKWVSEELVRRYATSWLILRLGNMIGPGLKKNPVYDALNGQPLWMSAESHHSFIHTRVVAEGLHKLVRERYRNYVVNMCGTGTVRVADLPDLVGREIVIAPGAEERRQLYWVNNTRMSQIIPVPESRAAVVDYVSEREQSGGAR
jgi:nucleoside-diphosphate-sugar epimerase